MKKDALYWGIIAAFGSFVLMIVWMVYDVWKTERVQRQLEAVAVTEEPSKVEEKDFSRIKTIKGKDGKEMVWIQEGPFPMGSREAEGDPDEMPNHIVYLPGYYIDLKEVTFAEYQKYVDSAKARPPVIPVFQDDLSKITAPEQPVVGVTWFQAKDYCDWAGERLPTEAEWEKAARGEDGFRWPWGDTSNVKAANTSAEDDGFAYSAPSGRFEIGRSPYGLYDMAGNVAEWVSDVYDPKYYGNSPFRNPKGPEKGKHRVYRGGSWNDSFQNVRTAKRFAAAPHQASAVIGIRCVKEGSEKEASD
jgi:sulfatase modifying factor 1